MTIQLALIAVGVSLVSSLISSAILILVWGYGGGLAVVKKLKSLEDEQIRLDDKLTREVKTRAGLASKAKTESRSEADEILRLAKAKLESESTVLSPYKSRTGIVRKAHGQ